MWAKRGSWASKRGAALHVNRVISVGASKNSGGVAGRTKLPAPSALRTTLASLISICAVTPLGCCTSRTPTNSGPPAPSLQTRPWCRSWNDGRWRATRQLFSCLGHIDWTLTSLTLRKACAARTCCARCSHRCHQEPQSCAHGRVPWAPLHTMSCSSPHIVRARHLA